MNGLRRTAALVASVALSVAMVGAIPSSANADTSWGGSYADPAAYASADTSWGGSIVITRRADTGWGGA